MSARRHRSSSSPPSADLRAVGILVLVAGLVGMIAWMWGWDIANEVLVSLMIGAVAGGVVFFCLLCTIGRFGIPDGSMARNIIAVSGGVGLTIAVLIFSGFVWGWKVFAIGLGVILGIVFFLTYVNFY